MKHVSRIFLCCCIVVLAGCTRVGQPPVTAAPSPTSLVVAGQWHPLYTRPGWQGGAALDLRAVGDIMLGRFVARSAEQRGYAYPFAQVQPLLDGDLTLGNLESPLTDRDAPLRPGPYRLPAPTAFAAPLRMAGFDALALANNHALDLGVSGLQDAVQALTRNQILPLGVGPDGATAHAPVITTTGGLRVALLAFNDIADPEDRPDEAADWGRAWLDTAALAAVRQAREQADLVLILVHWGHEYMPQPSARQHAWARKLVGAGADLVIGAHPHLLQSTEMLQVDGHTGFVAYSLGNFIFDQGDRPETSTGAVLRVLLNADGVDRVEVAPVAIVGGQPQPLPLHSTPAQAALTALNGKPAAGDERLDSLQAWEWDGTTAYPVEVPPDMPLPVRPQQLQADLRGDGQPLRVTLDSAGIVEVRDGAAADAPLVWRNEEANWRVTRMAVGDPNDDGRIELLLLLWKPDAAGVLRSHPFLLGWRGGRYRIIWGGSATAVPMQDLAVGDLDGDGWHELVVLEGGRAPGDPAEAVSIWRWFGWGFQQEWRAAGTWSELALVDVTGDGMPEIIAGAGSTPQTGTPPRQSYPPET